MTRSFRKDHCSLEMIILYKCLMSISWAYIKNLQSRNIGRISILYGYFIHDNVMTISLDVF